MFVVFIEDSAAHPEVMRIFIEADAIAATKKGVFTGP